VVSLRTLHWKYFWDDLVRVSQQLEELGVGDEEVGNV
jgi:hypothetical protein